MTLTMLILLTPLAHSQTRRGTPARQQKPVKEMELGTIYIEAEVEKPRVALLPKRIRPQLGEIEFVDRSFKRELHRLPNTELLRFSFLFRPKKIRPVSQLYVRK